MESVEEINKKLLDNYGYFGTTNYPKFRVVWSHDIFEKRWTDKSPEGFQLLSPIIRELPKYRQWNDDRYILEIMVAVPIGVETDLVEKISYEPLWTFQDNQGFPLPPRWDACKIIVDLMNDNMRMGSVYARYKEKNESPEEKANRIDRLAEELFGPQDRVGDAMISVPGRES